MELLLPIAYQADTFACEFDAFVPPCAMNQWTLEIVEAWDVRPTPCVEDASRID